MTPFWRFWTAGAVSAVGTSVTTVALPLTALVLLKASAAEMGLVSGASFLGWAVLGLPAGAICQYLPLRGVQVTTDLLRAAALASIPICWWAGVLSVAQLIVVAAAVSFCTVLFDVSNSTFLPAIVDENELQVRNGWMSGLQAATDTVGPPSAGVLVQVAGPAAALIVDTVSYVVSAVILRTLPSRHQPRAAQRAGLVSMIREGWRFVTRHPIMRACLLDATASNFVAGGFLVLIPLFVIRQLGSGAFVLGLILAAEGVGGLLGASLASRVSAKWGTARAAFWASILSCVLVQLLPLGSAGPRLVVTALGSVGFAAGAAVTSTNTRTFRQMESPPEMLTRVMATVRFVSWGVVPVGSLLAGYLAAPLGIRPALALFCLLSWLSPLALLLSPVRSLRDLRPVRAPVEN